MASVSLDLHLDLDHDYFQTYDRDTSTSAVETVLDEAKDKVLAYLRNTDRPAMATYKLRAPYTSDEVGTLTVQE